MSSMSFLGIVISERQIMFTNLALAVYMLYGIITTIKKSLTESPDFKLLKEL
jgi:hypothetical protein